jgi:hypothetical protein
MLKGKLKYIKFKANTNNKIWINQYFFFIRKDLKQLI